MAIQKTFQLCLLFALFFATFGLDQATRDKYLREHNAKRSGVSPPAANMKNLKYSVDLEKSAQAWVDRCKWSHGVGDVSGRKYKNFGQNMYMQSGAALTPDKVLTSWDNEKKDFTLSSNSCRRVCGHYTQVVWAATTKVGCGVKRCSSVSGMRNADFVVCNYYPAGNYVGKSPYTPRK